MLWCYNSSGGHKAANCAMIEMSSSLSWWVVGSRDSRLADDTNGRVEVRTCPVGVRLSI